MAGGFVKHFFDNFYLLNKMRQNIKKTHGKPTTIEQRQAFLSSYYRVYWFKKKVLGGQVQAREKNDKMNKMIKVILSDASTVYMHNVEVGSPIELSLGITGLP
jgi:hypothetical protein